MDEILITQLPRERACAALARRFVERHLGGLLEPEQLADAKLVVTELVDNAYLHGRGKIELKLLPRPGAVRVEVVDEGDGARLKIRDRSADDLGGHGLRVIEQLCTAWGAYEGTTHVWADLPAG